MRGAGSAKGRRKTGKEEQVPLEERTLDGPFFRQESKPGRREEKVGRGHLIGKYRLKNDC